MVVATMLALALTLPAPTAFNDPPRSADPAIFGSGGEDEGSQLLPAIASVLLGTLLSGGVGFLALSLPDVLFPGATVLFALVVDVLGQSLIPSLLGIHRNFLSSTVGTLGGLLLAVAGGVLGGVIGRAVGSGGSFTDLAYGIAGFMLCFAIGPPVLTLIDLFGLSRTTVPVSVRLLDARPVERT